MTIQRIQNQQILTVRLTKVVAKIEENLGRKKIKFQAKKYKFKQVVIVCLIVVMIVVIIITIINKKRKCNKKIMITVVVEVVTISKVRAILVRVGTVFVHKKFKGKIVFS